MIYIVVRRPCLMEDEGRYFNIGFYQTRVEAERWIASQKGEYFTPGAYFIAEVKAGE